MSNYKNNFKDGLNEAHKAERMVIEAMNALGRYDGKDELRQSDCDLVSSTLSDETIFYDASGDEREYYHGDILAYLNLFDGGTVGIDVKNDGVFDRSGNLNAEHEIWKDYYLDKFGSDDRRKGFMQDADYDYVAYHCKNKKYFYIVDFKMWRDCYREVPGRGYSRQLDRPMRKNHYDDDGNLKEVTYSYLNSVDKLRDMGVIKARVDYGYSGKYGSPDGVWVTDVEVYSLAC